MNRQAGRVSIRLCYVDGVESVREETLARPVTNDFAAREVVQRLFEKARGRRIQIRHLEITMADLREAPRQLSLFGGAPPGSNEDLAAHGEMEKVARMERRDSVLTAALDRIRTRFGDAAVGFKRSSG
jgi:hypothetical protein